MMSSNDYLQPQRPTHITVNSDSSRNVLDAPPNAPAPGGQRNLLSYRPPISQPTYGPGPGESTDHLLDPSTARNYRPNQYAYSSRSGSAMSSRRESWASEGGESALGPFASPFDDSRAPSRAGSEDDVNTQTVAEKYNIMPSAGLLLFPEDVEKDDYLHNPVPGDDDREKCECFNRRALVNFGGLGLIGLAMLALMVFYPILTFYRKLEAPKIACQSDPDCLSNEFPLLKNVRSGLIDPDTPESAKTKTAKDGTQLQLVFSDEFNTDGRTFYDGDDAYFQGMDFWYGSTQDLEWYDPDAITTGNGTLNIRFDAFQNHNLNYRSGMLQSWNKLCFKGGRLEASISLPGRGDVSGFWPGFWTMGNLGRPGYQATTDGMWPYSYWDKCDMGITPNQSSPDGLNYLPGMKLPACTCSGDDHPSPGNSRSAPELDAIEAQVTYMGPGKFENGNGAASQSFQMAPFDVFYLPDYQYVELYDSGLTAMNSYTGGIYQQAFSGVSYTNNDWFDGKGYQTYGFEYTPGAEGDVAWFIGDDGYTWKIDHRALRPNGNVGQRVLPAEPMTIVMNLGMGNSFAQVLLADINKLLPATMRFDYIRIYQNPDDVMVTCDPPGYPTTEYISQHKEAYQNPNHTSWQGAGYSFPQNSFMNGCST